MGSEMCIRDRCDSVRLRRRRGAGGTWDARGGEVSFVFSVTPPTRRVTHRKSRAGALARDATRALVDTELRPDAEEGRALKRVMSAPGDSLASSDLELLWKFRPVWKSKFYGAFVLNRRVLLHAIDATPARWRGDAGSSPLDRARTAASSPRNDLVKNCRVHPTHWFSTQDPTRMPRRPTAGRSGS